MARMGVIRQLGRFGRVRVFRGGVVYPCQGRTPAHGRRRTGHVHQGALRLHNAQQGTSSALPITTSSASRMMGGGGGGVASVAMEPGVCGTERRCWVLRLDVSARRGVAARGVA